MAPRYAGSPRRWHRNREASELASLRQRTLLYPISVLATCRHLTGFHCNGNGNGNGHFTSNGNCRCAERQMQRQLSLRGTSNATATVAARNVKGNGNGRCAGKGNCSARREPLPGRGLLTASMLTGLVGLSAAQPNTRAVAMAHRSPPARLRMLGFLRQPDLQVWLPIPDV